MTVNINRKLVFKILLGLGILLAISAIFCCFGNAVEFRSEGAVLKTGESMFNFMFGSNDERVSSPGLIVLFVFELIALLGGVALVVLIFMDILSKKQFTIYILALAGLLLVCAILSFCTRAFVYNAYLRMYKDLYPSYIPQFKEAFKYAHISSGPISYSILTLIGFISLSSSAVILNLKE